MRLLQEKERILQAMLQDVREGLSRLPRLSLEAAEGFARRSRERTTRLEALDRALERSRAANGREASFPGETARAQRIRSLAAALMDADGRLRAAAEALRQKLEKNRAAAKAGKRCLKALRPWRETRSRRCDTTR